MNNLPEPWTGRLIGKMHNNGITMDMLAKKMGCGKPYVSMILNSKRRPDGIQKRMENAVSELIEENRKENEA